MTIHHDKLAYGRLAKMSGEMTDNELLKMLSDLNSDGDEEEEEEEKDNKEDK